MTEYTRKQVDWHLNPPPDFKKWWAVHPDCVQGISVNIAWNCLNYRDQWCDAVASVAPDP